MDNTKQKVTATLTSPLGYKYKLVFIYNYTGTNNNKIIEDGTFYIGNPKTRMDEACITISVTYVKRMLLSNPSIANLILVKYYETCSENRGLKRGTGTIDMMNTAMSFVKQMCPFIRAFKLNDSSAKKCDNGATIPLPYFYITQKGRTWYEDQFGAYLDEPNYTIYRTRIHDVMNMPITSFDAFIREYINDTSTPRTTIDILNAIYKPQMTVSEYFNALYRTHNKSVVCELLQPWIDSFMKKVGLLHYINNEWYIPVSRIPTYSFYNTNGTRSIRTTRKRDPWNNSNLQ
jgi:hypothetical protein